MLNKFYISNLDQDYKKELINRFNDVDVIDNLVILNVLYYDFNNQIKEGQIVCNEIISNKLINIFKTLFENKYKIEKIKLIDEYDFDDIRSMNDNNTSCFNYRKILNTNKLSKHAYGLAIDINPLFNPYITLNKNNEIQIYPESSEKYIDRTKCFEHKIDEKDLCYKLFIENGFEWGGNWEYPDYQHFEYNIT